MAGGFFVFQGSSLVVPADIPGGAPDDGICGEKAYNAFVNEAEDCFSVPSLDGGDIMVLSLKENFPLPPEWKTSSVRHALDSMIGGNMADGSGAAGRMLRACHICQWRKDSRFCGSCGSPNQDAESGETARQCPRCGRMEFPRISPAVITIILNDRDEALLAHNKKFAPGVYSLIAGFNEAGESLEATVVREIREEVGLEVADVRYIRSQPWPFPNSLMLGFTARYASGLIKPDGIEIEDARWFNRDNLPLLPGNGSVSRYLIGLWQERKI